MLKESVTGNTCSAIGRLTTRQCVICKGAIVVSCQSECCFSFKSARAMPLSESFCCWDCGSEDVVKWKRARSAFFPRQEKDKNEKGYTTVIFALLHIMTPTIIHKLLHCTMLLETNPLSFYDGSVPVHVKVVQ